MTSRPYITYTLADACGIFPLDAIIEIYRVVAFASVEGAPSRMIGTCTFRGIPLFGIDIRDSFNILDHVYDEEASLIVLRAGDFLFGIIADKIGDIIRVDDSQEIPRDHYPAFVTESHIRKAYVINDTPHFELDPLRLFTEEDIRWFHDQSSSMESSENRFHV